MTKNNMQELFEQLLRKQNISEEQIKEFAAGFSVIVLLKLISMSEDRLTSEEKMKIEEALRKDDLATIHELILSKYPTAEFEQALETHILPLFEDYRKQVLT